MADFDRYNNNRGGSSRGGYRKDDRSSNNRGGGSNNRGGYRSNDRFDNERSDRSNNRGGYRKDDRFDSERSDRNNSRGGYRSNDRYDNERSGGSNNRGGYRSNDRYDNERSERNERSNSRGGYRKDERFDNNREERFERTRREETLPVQEENRQDELPNLIMGRNAVKEAIKAGRDINRILHIPEPDGSLREILSLAKDARIPLREVSRMKLDELTRPFGYGQRPGNHQGIVAEAAGMAYCQVQDILDLAKERNEAPFVVVLDGLEDPHNLGSILRTAHAAGVHGVIIPKRRAVAVTAAAVKAAAGATEHMLVARVANLSSAIEELKKAGLWAAGADMSGQSMAKASLAGPLVLVIGGEGEGLSRLVRERCDFTVSIPMKEGANSLNASVAAAVLIYEKLRQDGLN